MNLQFKLFFIIIFSLFLGKCQDLSDKVLITRLSNNQADGQGNQYSSMGGGTLFYMKGSGFDLAAENNRVYIGNDLAKIIGANSAYLMFETIPQTVQGKYPIRLSVKNSITNTERQVSCMTDCNVYYDWGFTTELKQIKPHSSGPTEYVNFVGIPRFTSSDQIEDIRIGPFFCDREGLDEVTYNPWDYNSRFQCRVAPEMEAGYYNSTFKVKDHGYSKNLPSFPSLSPSGQLYDFKCYPLINQVSSNVGSPNGQIIKISGNGFSQKENVVVIAGDHPCKVLASDLYGITCEVQSQSLNQTIFTRGSGIDKKVYDLGSQTNNLGNLANGKFKQSYWNNSVALPLKSSTVQAEIDRMPATSEFSFNIYNYNNNYFISEESNIVEVWDGYFKAPVTGKYRFYLSGRENADLYLSNVSNCKNTSNLQRIAYYYTPSTYEGPYYNDSQRSAYIDLQKDQYYLLNSFHSAFWWGSYFSISVEIPSAVMNPKSMGSVQLLDINFQTFREIEELKIYNYKQVGKFKIVVAARNPDGSDYLRESNPMFYNISDNDLKNEVSQGARLNWRYPNVTRYPLFSNGSIITDKSFLNLTNGYLFQINFTYYRAEIQNRPIQPKIVLLDVNVTQQPYYSIIQTQAPSYPLSGNITLEFNGTTLDPFPVTSDRIDNLIAKIPGLDRGFFTDRWGDLQESHKYVFRLSGLTKVPVMNVIHSEAVGGIPGTVPNISVTEIILDSNNTFYSPISSEFLYLKSETPQILVTVNGILGKCVQDVNCSYIISRDITPVVQNFTVTQSGLNIVISNYSLSLNRTSVFINFASSICTITSFSLPNIQCVLPKNNNSLQLEAGNYKPLIHVDNIGYMIYNPNLKDYFVPLVINSVSPNKGSSQGGAILQITGNGFPFNPERLSSLDIRVGGTPAQIIQSNNLILTIRTPPISKSNYNMLSVSVNQQNVQSNIFQYNDSSVPIVAKLTPSSSSPSKKSIIIIQGANFPTDTTPLKVILFSIETNRTYELSILNSTSNQIYAVLGGGKRGSYQLKVWIDQIGYSKENVQGSSLFKYELNVISISPNVGSLYGGTNLTISGVNFSPLLKQNQVFIGDNNFCVVLESNQNFIVCQTKPAPTGYENTLLNVTVTQRVSEEALCSAKVCIFTYKTSSSPIINTTNGITFISARAGETVTLNGTNLAPLANNKVTVKFVKGARDFQNYYFDMALQVDAFEATNNSIKFIMPALIAGSYTIQVYVGNKGLAYIDPAFTIVTPIEVYGIVINNGNLDNSNNTVSRGGLIINVTGNGFYDEIIAIDNNVWWCPIIQNSTTMISCTIRDIYSEIRYTVSVFRDPVNKFSCKNNCSFNISAKKTPYVQASSCNNSNISPNFTCTVLGDMLNISSNPIPYLSIYSYDNKYLKYRIAGKVISVYQKNLTFSFTNVPNNTYRFELYYEHQGYASVSSNIVKNINIGLFNVSSDYISSSYYGGKIITFNGNIFPDMYMEKLNNITICSSICKVVNYSLNSVKCQIPKLLNPQILDKYRIADNEADFITDYDVNGDTLSAVQYINDKKLSTYYQSRNSFCSITFDFKKDFLFEAQQIHYYPSTVKNIQSFYGLVFQGSFDGVNWDILFTLDRNIKTGWNVWQGNFPSYRFFKIRSLVDKHDSQCMIAEVKFFGVKYYGGSDVMESDCETKLSLNGWTMILPSAVHYSQNNTPVVTQITPNLGPTSGATPITISGDGFGYSAAGVNVLLDGVKCVVKTVANDKIICVTGARNYFIESTIEVSVNGNKAIIQGANFTYIDRWSDPNTWGGEAPPREGDSVYIPPGQNVLLDVTTPLLYSVIVEGSLIFEDKDKNFSAYFLVCMNGRVQIGTKSQPFRSKLIITMYGDKTSTQLPEFGNKVWAFHNGILDMHGIPKKVTWTLLASTANVGDTSILLTEPVDWSVGDEIGIASTDFNHNHSESRRIKKIGADFKTIVIDAPLVYRHYSAIEKYDSNSFPMQCEVGLLTRNILFKGTYDDSSVSHKYGAHLMLHMPGSIGRITYTEFKYVGQGTTIGRYPMHFHRIDDASESFVIGNAVHESWARVVAIHDSHFLTVQKNVGYKIFGHAYFIEDGIETNNLLEDNLAISITQIWTLINTDVTASAFWITNPNNIVRRNRAAGGDWFGFWYQLDNRATGPSANPDICPEGTPLGEFSNNFAHSFNAFGLRIFQYIPRTFPCQDESSDNISDMFSSNPAVPAVFENFTAWRNFENGVMAEHLGAVELRNFLIADSRLSGIQISMTSYAHEDETKINGAVIVGLSNGNKDNNTSIYIAAVGLTTPRTDNLLVKNVRFYNFLDAYGMSAMKSCSKCWHPKLKITGGKTTKFENLAFTSVDRKIIWDGTKKEVFEDADGSFIGQIGSITAYYPHIDGIPECYIPDQDIYD